MTNTSLRDPLLKRLFKQRKVKQCDAANAIGISQAALSAIVNGSTPGLRVAQRIAKLLGKSTDEVFPLEPQ